MPCAMACRSQPTPRRPPLHLQFEAPLGGNTRQSFLPPLFVAIPCRPSYVNLQSNRSAHRIHQQKPLATAGIQISPIRRQPSLLPLILPPQWIALRWQIFQRRVCDDSIVVFASRSIAVFVAAAFISSLIDPVCFL